MSRHERLIQTAIELRSGKTVYADEIFENQKDGNAIRREYHEKEKAFLCIECGQALAISTSQMGRLYFKHRIGHDYCVLTDESLSQQEREEFSNIHRCKESKRHRHLKNTIGNLLSKVDGVDPLSILIDNKFIVRDLPRKLYPSKMRVERPKKEQLSDEATKT